ncbi:MAG TPA: ABC transporter ATP-binding protein [Acidisarcina sp.]
MSTVGRHEVAFRGVTKRYGERMAVLADVDFSVSKGEFVSVIGPSGCGKSTLLKLVSGLTPPSAGTVAVDGSEPAAARGIVSYIFQDPTLLPWRTVQQNVALGLELEGISRSDREQRVQSMLTLVGLSDVVQAFPRQLSGGMKMRVSIARALVSRPRILLMDEPFAALDEMTRDRLNEELLRLREEGQWTVIFVTHAVTEAVFLSSRILILAPHPGRIAHDIQVDLPYPRNAATRGSAALEERIAAVSKALRGVQSL